MVESSKLPGKRASFDVYLAKETQFYDQVFLGAEEQDPACQLG